MAELFRALTLILPEIAQAMPAAPAEAPKALVAPPFAPDAPVLPVDLPAAASQLAEIVNASPARLAELLALVEARSGEVLAALPGAVGLDVLLEAIERLPPPPADAVPAGPAAAAPGEGGRPELTRLLDRLLAALSELRRAGGAGRPELPAELRSELEQLPTRARTALRELAASRERALIENSTQLQNLGRAHRALLAASQRTALGRLGSMANSAPGANFTYVEIPTSFGQEATTARLRVMVKGDGGGARGKTSGRRSVRAIMDLSLSALGEVWTEVILTGKQLAVRMELPDEERRDFVTKELPALAESLEARGLQPELAATARRPDERGLSGELWPEAGATGGLDLWA